MNNRWVWACIAIYTILVPWAWLSAWTEQQCETHRIQQQRGNPPPGTPTACVCAPKGSEQTNSTGDASPECDWPEMKPEWALVIVGIITFIGILWQARETKRAAEATAEMVALQCPVLQIKNPVIQRLAPGESLKFAYVIKNVGTQAARNVIVRTTYRIFVGPKEPDYSSATPGAEHFVGISEDFTTAFSSDAKLTDQEVALIESERALHIFGFVEYQGLRSDTIWIARFGYFRHPDDKGMYLIEKPSGYNRIESRESQRPK